ncbi:MAG: hypothetical protein V5788_08535 [Shewanella sp.]
MDSHDYYSSTQSSNMIRRYPLSTYTRNKHTSYQAVVGKKDYPDVLWTHVSLVNTPLVNANVINITKKEYLVT